MKKLKTLLAAAATCAVCLGAAAGSKYALVVGINKYDAKYKADFDFKDLYGCVTDAKNVTDVLVTRGGWPTDSVRLLTDSSATVANVQTTLGQFAERVQSGDTFVLYWSAHGSYAYKSTGYEQTDLCAYDADYTDKMLAADLGRFPSGAKVVVVIDACNAGGLFQTATVGGKAKAAAPTFVQRVDALLSRSKAGGIAAGEVGWMTAVAYNQNTNDGPSGIGGSYTSCCLVYDGVYWGKADTDDDGDISFLDLHNHARKWFSSAATKARAEAIYGKGSKGVENAVKKNENVSPQMLHEDVLAEVLVRDHAAAGGNKYPFKVEFHLVCGDEAADDDYASISNNAVQFVWSGESAVEPMLDIKSEVYAFEGWDADFDDVREDLIVRGTCANVNAIESFTKVAETVKKFVGFALTVCTDRQTSNDYQCVAAAFEGAYAKGGKLTVTLTGVDGTKEKFTGRLDEESVGNFFLAELTSAKSDDTIAIKMSVSTVCGTYRHGDAEYPIQGNWDWLSTRETFAQAVRERYAAVYNVGMDVKAFDGRKELSEVGGYVNVVLSEQNGKAKVTGMLGDGTKISVTTKAVVLSTLEESLNAKGVIYVPIVFARTNKSSGFSGLLTLTIDSDGARCADFGYTLKDTPTRAYCDNFAQDEATAYRACLDGKGSEFIAAEMPETASTDMPYTAGVPPLYVKVGGRYAVLTCETNELPSRCTLAYANGKFKVTDPLPDNAKLKLTLNKRTGVVSGSFRVWYADDPEDPSVEKYVTATVYGGWESSGNKASAFGLVTDTNPDRAKLKLKVPIKLVIGEPAASDEADED